MVIYDFKVLKEYAKNSSESKNVEKEYAKNSSESTLYNLGTQSRYYLFFLTILLAKSPIKLSKKVPGLAPVI
jgi:hypothetical protein